MASESADGSNSAWWGFRRDEVASEASTEGGESGASSVAPSTCSEQPNVATLSRGNVCDVCGDDLPSRMTVCAACWFKKWQAVASLGHFSKPGRGESKKNKVAPEPESPHTSEAEAAPSSSANEQITMPAGASSSNSANEQMGTPAARMSMVKLGLMRGPPKGVDPDGCGLQLTWEGVVAAVMPGGIADRWGEFRVGDQIVSISDQQYQAGTPLASYFRSGQDAYLCEVLRKVPEHSNVWMSLASNAAAQKRSGEAGKKKRKTKAPKPRFEHEEAAIQALAFAGDFHKGTKGTNRFY